MIWWRKKRAGKTPATGPRVEALPSHIRTVYAIGDVHGCADLAKRAEARILNDSAFCPDSTAIVYLGDLVDRGPDTAFLLDFLLSRRNSLPRRYFLCGNHEEMMLAFFASPRDHLNWLDFGGYETLNSYGILNRLESLHRMKSRDLESLLATSVPQEHLAFLKDMPDAIDASGFFLCHAGVNPALPLAEQTAQDLHWSRNRFMSHEDGFEKTIVHGHTPVPQPVHAGGRVSIDTEAYQTNILTIARIGMNDQKVEFMMVSKADDC